MASGICPSRVKTVASAGEAQVPAFKDGEGQSLHLSLFQIPGDLISYPCFLLGSHRIPGVLNM